ncbi:MAG: alpha-amylase, partial [Victivallales bacterium]|nr:alpha-amylase [Victivallales bacterium]
MSGKFHTAWGEFGGFKDPEAIRYEAASMIAFGASCNVGDQLHPCGQMDLGTYANIGHAYEYVEEIEDYGVGGLPVASLGLWLAHSAAEDEGAAQMLMEEQIDFDVISPGDDLTGFETIIVPSRAGILDDSRDAFAAYLSSGGKALILEEGALNATRDACTVDIGADYAGPGEYDVDYTVVASPLSEGGLVTSPFLNYESAARVT